VRILEVIPTLVRGGAEKQLTMLATRLPSDTFDVHVAVLTHGGPNEETLRERGLPVTHINKSWKIDPAAYWRLKKLIVRLRPDIVHTWIFAANSYGRAAAFAAGVKHVIAGERCVDSWKVSHELAIDRYLAKRTERIVTNSSGVRDFYVQQGLPREKFTIIPNGIEASDIPMASREEVLNGLNLPSDARLIGAVGRLWPQKRYKDLIWAAELLKAARDDTHLLIVGDGPQRDMLRKFTEDVRVDDRVHFLGERDDVPRLLPHLDCFWLGSGYEGQSNALMEAMLAGLPVVATDIPGNRDLIEPDESGLLVSVGDAGQLARKTTLILDDAAIARRLGEGARRRIMTEFTVQKMVDRHAELYQGMI
jgi:glycosyltransferase involved in cell wall biosynthesis